MDTKLKRLIQFWRPASETTVAKHPEWYYRVRLKSGIRKGKETWRLKPGVKKAALAKGRKEGTVKRGRPKKAEGMGKGNYPKQRAKRRTKEQLLEAVKANPKLADKFKSIQAEIAKLRAEGVLPPRKEKVKTKTKIKTAVEDVKEKIKEMPVKEKKTDKIDIEDIKSKLLEKEKNEPKFKSDIETEESGGLIKAKFKYDKDIIDEIKNIDGRKYNSDTREWTIPLSGKEELEEIKNRYGKEIKSSPLKLDILEKIYEDGELPNGDISKEDSIKRQIQWDIDSYLKGIFEKDMLMENIGWAEQELKKNDAKKETITEEAKEATNYKKIDSKLNQKIVAKEKEKVFDFLNKNMDIIKKVLDNPDKTGKGLNERRGMSRVSSVVDMAIEYLNNPSKKVGFKDFNQGFGFDSAKNFLNEGRKKIGMEKKEKVKEEPKTWIEGELSSLKNFKEMKPKGPAEGSSLIQKKELVELISDYIEPLKKAEKLERGRKELTESQEKAVFLSKDNIGRALNFLRSGGNTQMLENMYGISTKDLKKQLQEMKRRLEE